MSLYTRFLQRKKVLNLLKLKKGGLSSRKAHNYHVSYVHPKTRERIVLEDVISQKLSDHVPKNGQLQNADSFDNDNSGGKPERNSSTPTNQTGNHNNSTNTIVIDDNTMEEDSKKEDAGDGKIKWSCDNYEKNYIIDNPRSRTKKKNNLKKKKSNPEEWSVSFSIDDLIKKN